MTPHLTTLSHLAGQPDGALSPLLQLAVITASPAAAVSYAGGWLFVRTMAGWDATVLTEGRADPRPCQILGARARSLDSLRAAPLPARSLLAIVIQADLYDSDPWLSQVAHHALAEDHAELLICGGPLDRSGRTGSLARHRLSVAARAFKAQALAAAAAPAGARNGIEDFWKPATGSPGYRLASGHVGPAPVTAAAISGNG
jgi:hypothetical protein